MFCNQSGWREYPLIVIVKERKYFDSGDYALSKAGKASDAGVTQIGREHPVPEKIPHNAQHPHPLRTQAHNHGNSNGAAVIINGNSAAQRHSSFSAGSPVKESSFLHQETSAEEVQTDTQEQKEEKDKGQFGQH